jgi:hypothetical protein
MKRFRLSTLMLVVVIVALVIALFRERRRSESALAELKIGQARAQTTMTFCKPSAELSDFGRQGW